MDFDAGELGLVGERRFNGCDGVLVFCQDLFVGLDGVGDEVTRVERSGVTVGAPARGREDNGCSEGTVNVCPGAVSLTVVEDVLREARQVDLGAVPADFGGPWVRQRDKLLVVTVSVQAPVCVDGQDRATLCPGNDDVGGFVAACLLVAAGVLAAVCLIPDWSQPFEGVLGGLALSLVDLGVDLPATTQTEEPSLCLMRLTTSLNTTLMSVQRAYPATRLITVRETNCARVLGDAAMNIFRNVIRPSKYVRKSHTRRPKVMARRRSRRQLIMVSVPFG